MNISNTNVFLFPIFYTCINYNPTMNPVKFRPDQIQSGQPNPIFVCWNWPNIWKLCQSRGISPNTNEYFFPIFYLCINFNLPMNPVKICPDQIQNGRLIAIFVCWNWPNIWKFCLSGWISQTPMNIFSNYSTHALTTILPGILWSFIRIKFKMTDLLLFLFAQIDKIFENVVRPDKYLTHQWTFCSDTLQMHLPPSSHESCEVLSGSN